MNFTFLWIITGLLFVGFIVYIILNVYIKNKQKQEPQDRSWVFNNMPKYSKGHNKGIVNRVIEQKNWVAVEFFPRDINYVKLLNEGIKLDVRPEVVFVPKNNLKTYSRGSSSDHTTDLEIIPISQLDIPFGLSEAKIKYLKDEIERCAISNDKLDYFEDWKESQREILTKTITDLPERYVENLSGFFRELSKMYQSSESKRSFQNKPE